MTTRTASAAALLPIVGVAVWLGGGVWVAFLSALAARAAWEALGLTEAASDPVAKAIGSIAAGGVVAAAAGAIRLATGDVLALTVVAALALQLRRAPAQRSAAGWATTVAVASYAGLLLGYAAQLRLSPGGLPWTAALLGLVWANDSAAYVAGRRLGRTPLAPDTSPKKTWEGFVAGALATVVVALALPSLSARLAAPDGAGFGGAPTAFLIAMGLAVALAAPLGDLAQSFLKRQAGVKDSGDLIPGHGGLLDRLDSLMFAAPVVYAAAAILPRLGT